VPPIKRVKKRSKRTAQRKSPAKQITTKRTWGKRKHLNKGKGENIAPRKDKLNFMLGNRCLRGDLKYNPEIISITVKLKAGTTGKWRT